MKIQRKRWAGCKLALLLLVAAEGLSTFWPPPLVGVRLLDGRSLLGEPVRTEECGAEQALAGVPAAARPAAERALADAGGRSTRELLRTGNFELTNEHYTWVAAPAVAERSAPEWAVVVETASKGRCYGTPAAWRVDGDAVATAAPEVLARFAAEQPELSRRSAVAPPALPPIQASPSFSRLSSYSCATLICNMRLPRGDVLVNRARIRIARELLAEITIAEHLGKLGQHAQMLLGRLLRDEEQKHQAHRLAVGRIERDGLGEANEGAHRFLQALDPSVRDGDTLTQPRGAEALAREQAVEHQASRDALIVLEQQPRLLEHALLAGDIQVEKDVRRRQKLRN